MKLDIKAIGQYNGHTYKPNGTMELKLKFSIDAKEEIIKSILFVNQTVTIRAKVENEKPILLGSFSFHNLNIDRDGESVLKFVSDKDCVYHENVITISDQQLVKFAISADIEMEDENE